MSNAAKQTTSAQDEEKDVITTLYLCLPLDIWSSSSREFIREHLPKLNIVEIDPQKNISEQVSTEGLGVLLCETKTKEQIERGLKIVRTFFDKIKQKDLIVSFITQHSNEAIGQLEKSNVIQILSPNTSTKALKVKVELLFSKMKAAKKLGNPLKTKITFSKRLRIRNSPTK